MSSCAKTRASVLQQKKPSQWEGYAPYQSAAYHLSQLEKALEHPWIPGPDKINKIKKNNKINVILKKQVCLK